MGENKKMALKKSICILGMGYIGLPTACMLANSGHDVLGVDINEEITSKLGAGKLHIEEPNLEAIFLKAFNDKTLKISPQIQKSDVYIIAVPTPLNSKNKAELSYVISAAEMIKEAISRGNLVILESTSPPGTTKNIVGKIITDGTGLIAGIDYFLAFCPERVLPGKIVHELVNNDRIIGGIDESSAQQAEKIYMSFVKGRIFTTGLETSEIVKLAENTFRDINIAYANELSSICGEYGIDVWEVIKNANMHPRVNILAPGPGVGGHCIPIDPWFIIENSRLKGTLIEKSRNINDSRPLLIAQKCLEIIAGYNNPKVTFLGFSYKEDVGDVRESPAISIYNELIKKGVKVNIHDPHIENAKFATSELEDACRDSDLLLLFVGHKIFSNLNFEKIKLLMKNANMFDTRHFFDKEKLLSSGFVYYGI